MGQYYKGSMWVFDKIEVKIDFHVLNDPLSNGDVRFFGEALCNPVARLLFTRFHKTITGLQNFNLHLLSQNYKNVR